ncbi:hypothetical protein MSAN_00686000 [Mycena sanguinolenta]|uniref:Transmembrane protein n=1 Tax=Mycena sanguinolenta TaxID=230812 RepID=A0A8H7DCL5_9AGAR|nr:hypothetical protein MSAN_00686000 [Mycena sanguinolenta]
MLSFPSIELQVVSALIHFVGITILTHFLSRSLAAENLWSTNALSRLTWPRLCTLIIFLDSWLFLFSSGILIFGIGLETNDSVCSAGIYLCIVFYSSSKLCIYAFLIEKVHVVWAIGEKRLRSPVYIICAITVGLYAGVIALLFFGRVSQFRIGDNVCVIGLKAIASIPLLSYDLYINVLLTGLFLWPLLRSNLSTPRLKRVAIRTLLSSGVALTTSTVNIVVLTVLKGHELGWVCLASCGTDVILNAFALFWVTGASRQGSATTSSCIECERRITETTSDGVTLNISAKNSSVKHLSKGPESLRSWENVNVNSNRNSLRPNDDPELAGRRHSLLRSMNVFRMGAAPREAQEFQIRVTTEFNSSTSPATNNHDEAVKSSSNPALAMDSL